MVYLLNTRPKNLALFLSDTADELVHAAKSVEGWPEYDLFNVIHS